MKKSGVWSYAKGVVLLSLACAAHAGDNSKQPAPAKPALTVTVSTPQTASLTQKITANGNLAAWQEAIVGAEANGLKITEVRVNVRDRVQRGDVLAVLQADNLLAEAAASAQEAQAQAERARSPQPAACSSKAFLVQRS